MFFDYFYGKEAEQFAFFMIPKIMLQDEFSKLSSDSKLLYGMLLNRNSLSSKNGWIDDLGRVYIIYTINEIMEDMNCCRQKAVKLLSELEKCGLIKKKRQGQGKPSLIYVMNFATNLSDQMFEQKPLPAETEEKIVPFDTERPQEKTTEKMKCDFHTSESMSEKCGEKMKCDFHTSRSMTPETRINTEKCDFHTSRSMNNRLLEVCFSDPSYNDINNNNINNIYHLSDQSNRDGIDVIDNKNKTDDDADTRQADKRNEREEDATREAYGSIIDENIPIEDAKGLSTDEKEIYKDLVNLIKYTVCIKNPTVSVLGQIYSGDTVRGVFLKLKSCHVLSVISNLKNVDMARIRSRKAYLMSSLYQSYLEGETLPAPKKKENTFNRFPQRKYDYDKLEQLLIRRSMGE